MRRPCIARRTKATSSVMVPLLPASLLSHFLEKSTEAAQEQSLAESSMMDGRTLQEVDAGASACSVEWCAIPAFDRHVACSTYRLEPSSSPNNNPPCQHAVVPANGESVEAVVSKQVRAGGGETEPETEDVARSNSQQQRTGTVLLYKLVGENSTLEDDDNSLSRARLVEKGRASLDGGVLDTKWSESLLDNGGAVLACATSTGRLVLYSLHESIHGGGREEGQAAMDEKQTNGNLAMVSSSDVGKSMLLSLDWSLGSCRDAKIVVSQSDGHLAVWCPLPSGDPIQELSPWPAHELRGGTSTEAWISFFRRGSGDASDSNFVVSGADDSLMKGWDLRASSGGSAPLPAFVCREHDAGVTAGQWHPTREHLFASGSYDERVRIWDSRNVRRPVLTAPTGGGLWRLKWHPDRDSPNWLLAACMHGGVSVLNTELMCEQIEPSGSPYTKENGTVARYTEHESMAYGADWCKLKESLHSQHPLIASCSFYDRRFCLWQSPPLWTR